MGRDFIAKFNMSSKMAFAPGVSMLEDCEGSMMWVGLGTGADWYVGFSDGTCLFGRKCLRLMTRATDPEVNDYCGAHRDCPLPEAKVLALSGRMAIPIVAKVALVRLYLEWYNGGSKYGGGLQWSSAIKTIGVLNSVGGFTTVDGLGHGLLENSWMEYKVVLDRGTKRYRYVEVNGVRSIQTGLLYETADAENLRLAGTRMYVYTALAEAATVDFDAMYVGSITDL